MVDNPVNSGPVLIPPNDSFNQELVKNVHPPTWKNPKPAGQYNLVVIGAGTAGLVTAAVAAHLGARVALIERHLMGGDCLNTGCVPSKGIIRAAREWTTISRGAEFGLEFPPNTRCNFDVAMARMRRLRAYISRTDSVKRFTSLGVDVFIGEAQFASRNTVKVDNTTLCFSRAVICTGTRPSAPQIPGLKETGYLTNETIFSLTKQPERLAVIGAGPIGCELAQSFARFGSKVVLLEQIDQILPREDKDAAKIVQNQMEKDGIEFIFDVSIDTVEQLPNKNKIIRYKTSKGESALVVDEILVSVGRMPNVENLDLKTAGVLHDMAGIKVNAQLQTSNPQIYAAGDVCFPFQFTHTADALAQIVIRNALFPHPFKLGMATTKDLIIPWCTFTDPEIAHVGMYESDAKAKGIEVETFTQTFKEIDRAILDSEDHGFARIHVKKGSDQILGATIVGPNAGNIISEVTVTMKAGAGLSVIGNTIHPYPTQAEVLRKLANQLRLARFSKLQKKFLSYLFSLGR